MKNNENQYTTIDFGIRVITNRNSSRTIALPKTALKNLSDSKFSILKIQLIHEGEEKFLKLIPVLDIEKVLQ